MASRGITARERARGVTDRQVLGSRLSWGLLPAAFALYLHSGNKEGTEVPADGELLSSWLEVVAVAGLISFIVGWLILSREHRRLIRIGLI